MDLPEFTVQSGTKTAAGWTATATCMIAESTPEASRPVVIEITFPVSSEPNIGDRYVIVAK